MYSKNHWIPAFAGRLRASLPSRRIQDILSINDDEELFRFCVISYRPVTPALRQAGQNDNESLTPPPPSFRRKPESSGLSNPFPFMRE